jgi:hypothetical protein
MRYAPAMRVSAILTAVVLSVVGVAAQPATSDRDAILKIIQAFTDTMAAQDVAGARKILQPQGRFHAMRMRDGKPDLRAFSNEEYFAELQGWKQKMRERIWNPDVRIDGLIATVRAPYDFWIDGKLNHCGIDAFDLIKTEEGWKIAGGVYTIESKCEPSPLGPLKQGDR